MMLFCSIVETEVVERKTRAVKYAVDERGEEVVKLRDLGKHSMTHKRDHARGSPSFILFTL